MPKFRTNIRTLVKKKEVLNCCQVSQIIFKNLSYMQVIFKYSQIIIKTWIRKMALNVLNMHFYFFYTLKYIFYVL